VELHGLDAQRGLQLISPWNKDSPHSINQKSEKQNENEQFLADK